MKKQLQSPVVSGYRWCPAHRRWDHHARNRAATNFKLELAEIENRHHLTFESFEEGKLTMEEYLSLVVFHEKRRFTRAQFQRFMFEQTKPHPEMIELVRPA